MANIIGCGVSQFPMKYLGVPVGCSMTRCTNWNTVVKKFSSKLCSWKARLLSVGGRLSLIKSVLGNLPTYYMSIYTMPVSIRRQLESMRNKFFIGGDVGDKKMTWIKWDKCLASKKDGGLGIGSIFGLNIALLFKWIWRFLNAQSDLWVHVIKCTHGRHGGISSNSNNSLKRSPWGAILSSVNKLKHQGIDLFSLCSRKVGNDLESLFWDDTWYGEQPLRTAFPRIYNLDTDKNCNIASRVSLADWSSVLRRTPRGGAEANQFQDLLNISRGITLSDNRDSWLWTVDLAKGYSVASARSLVDSFFLSSGSDPSRWNRNVPIKVNVFLWRAMLNKLPSRVNLDRRGIDVDSLLCPICLGDLETVNHSFFNCGLAKDLWYLLAKWWEMDIPVCGTFTDWFDWLDSLHVPIKVRLVLEGVGGTRIWSIWNFCNSLIFSSCPPRMEVLWDSIVSQSFLWISSRNPSRKFSWIG